jgi:hypothetical protein
MISLAPVKSNPTLYIYMTSSYSYFQSSVSLTYYFSYSLLWYTSETILPEVDNTFGLAISVFRRDSTGPRIYFIAFHCPVAALGY